jgi:hypothetical protein
VIRGDVRVSYRSAKCNGSNDEIMRDLTIYPCCCEPRAVCRLLLLCFTRMYRMAFIMCFWYNYNKDKPKLTRKSEDAVNTDHVLKVIYDAECGHVLAVMQASTRNASYTVNVSMAE